MLAIKKNLKDKLYIDVIENAKTFTFCLSATEDLFLGVPLDVLYEKLTAEMISLRDSKLFINFPIKMGASETIKELIVEKKYDFSDSWSWTYPEKRINLNYNNQISKNKIKIFHEGAKYVLFRTDIYFSYYTDNIEIIYGYKKIIYDKLGDERIDYLWVLNNTVVYICIKYKKGYRYYHHPARVEAYIDAYM